MIPFTPNPADKSGGAHHDNHHFQRMIAQKEHTAPQHTRFILPLIHPCLLYTSLKAMPEPTGGSSNSSSPRSTGARRAAREAGERRARLEKRRKKITKQKDPFCRVCAVDVYKRQVPTPVCAAALTKSRYHVRSAHEIFKVRYP